MVQIPPAQPTDYGGTRFRSKTEANMACVLTLNNCLWHYEPPKFKVGLWVPDFYVLAPDETEWLFEFKPGVATKAYKEVLAHRYDQLDFGYPGSLHCLLVCGTPFDIMVPRTMELYCSFDGSWIPKHWPGFFESWKEAFSFRYELEQPQA